MNITGLVVYARPERAAAVRSALESIAGVEVHAVTPDGRMIVTVERRDDRAAEEAIEAIGKIGGVLSTALVYHHEEELSEEANH